MRKLLLLVLVVVLGFNFSNALEPVAVSIIKTDGTAPFAISVELNDYETGSAVSVLGNTSIGNLSPNSSGVISFVVDGSAWDAITAGDVDSYYILDVKVDGSLYAQYRLDELVALSSSAEVEAAKTYKVGDFAHGGIVIYVDASGKHGLVISMEDIGPGKMRWSADTVNSISTDYNTLYYGEQNTMNIIAGQIEDDGSIYAAKACHNYRYVHDGIIYRNWYLPNWGEWVHLIQIKQTINDYITSNGGTAIPLWPYYWLSAEDENDTTRARIANLDQTVDDFKKSMQFSVRAVRAF